MRFWVAMVMATIATPTAALDCLDDDFFQRNLNHCPFVLANAAEQERLAILEYLEQCYAEFHSDESFRRIGDTSSWWPGDGRLPFEHLEAGESAWGVYRKESCTGEATNWGGSHFRFTGNMCLLRKAETRLRELHSLALNCRIVGMTGRPIDPDFAEYQTNYQFFSE